MSHGRVKEGDLVISASIPVSLLKKIDGLGAILGYDSRSETLRVILAYYFNNPVLKVVYKPPGGGDTP